MEKIQVIQPTKLLAPYIKQYWFLRIDDVKQGFQRSIPAGCVALVFHKGNKIISSFHKGTQPQSYISGQISTYSDIEFSFLDIGIDGEEPRKSRGRKLVDSHRASENGYTRMYKADGNTARHIGKIQGHGYRGQAAAYAYEGEHEHSSEENGCDVRYQPSDFISSGKTLVYFLIY